MPICYKLECTKDATRIYKGMCICDSCYLKDKVKEYKQNKMSTISIEFCVWLQDTDVFSTFTDHLNKGLRLEELNINAATMPTKVLKAKA